MSRRGIIAKGYVRYMRKEWRRVLASLDCDLSHPIVKECYDAFLRMERVIQSRKDAGIKNRK